jgi:DNA-binding transcriptional LysR family regulator
MDEIGVFLAIVEEGSQAAAARRLGRSLQSVNRALMALERDVGVELIRRTTRRSVATEAGNAFYKRVKPALAEIAEAQLEANNRRAAPRGLLRVGAPALFGAAFIVPAAAEFMARYREVEIDLKIADSPIDVIGDGLDLAVRIRSLEDSTLRTRKLNEIRIVVYGSPKYFERHGRPSKPADLADHRCVLRGLSEGQAEVWPFCENGAAISAQVKGGFRANETLAVQAAVRHGMGIGRGPFWHIRDLVDAGELEIVLEDFEPAPIPVQAVFPPSPLPPAKTRRFIDLLVKQLADERL